MGGYKAGSVEAGEGPIHIGRCAIRFKSALLEGHTLELTIPQASPASFEVTSGHPWIGLLRRLGSTRGIATGDSAFDEGFHVDCNSPPFVAEVFTEEGRGAVESLFSLGARSVRLQSGDLTAIFAGPEPHSEAEIQAIADAARDLECLAERIARWFGLPEDSWVREDLCHRVTFWMLLSEGCLIPALFFGAPGLPMDLDSIGFFAFIGGGAATILFFGIAIVMLGHKTWFWSLMLHSWHIAPSLILMPFAVAVFADTALDHAAPIERYTQVVDKVPCHGSEQAKRVYCRIAVASWRPGTTVEFLNGRDLEFRGEIPAGSAMRFMTKPGLLGYEWVVKGTLRTAQPPSWARPHGGRKGATMTNRRTGKGK